MSKKEVILYSLIIGIIGILMIGFFTREWVLAVCVGSFVGISRLMKGLKGLKDLNGK